MCITTNSINILKSIDKEYEDTAKLSNFNLWISLKNRLFRRKEVQ